MQSASSDIWSYWSLLSLSTEKHIWSSQLQWISWGLTIAIGNLGVGPGFLVVWGFFNYCLTTQVLRKTLKCSPENPNQRAFLCQAGICRWVWLSACTTPHIASRGFLISASGRLMPGRLERGQEEGRGLPGEAGGFEVWPRAEPGWECRRGAAQCSGCRAGGWRQGSGRRRAGKEAPSSGDSFPGSWVLYRQAATSSWGKPAVFFNSWFDIMKAE